MNWKTKILTFLSLFGGETSQPEMLPQDVNTAKKVMPYDMTMQEAYRGGYAESITEYLHKMEKSPRSIIKNDTVIISKYNVNKRICLGAYWDNKDSVYMHIFIGDTVGATKTEKQQIEDFVKKYAAVTEYYGVMAHELKHKDTTIEAVRQGLGYRYQKHLVLNVNFGPEDVILFNQHNEISARVSTVLLQREEYIKTGDLKVFSGFAKDYADALKRGVFLPGMMTAYQNELENMYIVKSVFDWWQTRERNVNQYVNRKKLTRWYEQGAKKGTERNLMAYKFLLDICYTYMKDGRLQNMNYFCNPLSSIPNEHWSLQDIEDRMHNFTMMTVSDLLFKPAILQDAEPQEEVLKIVPILQKKEKTRLDREDKQKAEKNAEQNLKAEKKRQQEQDEKIKAAQKQLRADSFPHQHFPPTKKHVSQSAYSETDKRKMQRQYKARKR